MPLPPATQPQIKPHFDLTHILAHPDPSSPGKTKKSIFSLRVPFQSAFGNPQQLLSFAGIHCPQLQAFLSVLQSSLTQSKRRRAGRRQAGELAPKLEATNLHQDGSPAKQPTKTLVQRIADTKDDDIVRKLAS
ncbi:hypothetical protein Pst134EB_008659 [Puccinia striiformis f. sp. tritici]|nr:hypothetical protein Pst134EB_008659 [Puccinia striiformis f. sp. tritici]